MYGAALAGRGDLEEALSYLLEGFDSLNEVEPDSPMVAVGRRIAAALVRLYEELEAPEEARRWRERARD
jgi:hypothetical protein